MATGYSTNLELALPVQGELSGTWGNTVNNGITQYLDAAIAGSQIISGSQTAVTLTNTNGDASASNIAQAGSGATGTAQYQIIRCTGNPAGLLTITISDTGVAGYSKTFVIINATSTSQSVKIVGSGPTTGITVASGAKSFVAWNGSDFVEIASSTADGVTTFSAGTTGLTPNTATSGAVTLAGTLAIANGGTGTATPALVQGSGVTITGTWPNQTINATGTGGTVTSVAVSGGTTGLTTSGGPITTSGTITLAGTLAVANGGTGITSLGAGVATFLGTPSSANLASAVTDETGSGALVFATSPTLVTPLLGTPTSGVLSGCTVDGTDAVGFRNIPQNSQSAAYTLVLADAGKHIFHPVGDNNARTFTIPANSSVAYPIGTAITFINMAVANVTIAITTDTMYLSSAGTTGSRTLAQYGSATAIKITSTNWLISGSGLT